MMMSRLSSKSQITLPKKIRERAGLNPGDLVGCEVLQNGAIELKRVEPLDATFHTMLSKTLDEWATPEDEAAFYDL